MTLMDLTKNIYIDDLSISPIFRGKNVDIVDIVSILKSDIDPSLA